MNLQCKEGVSRCPGWLVLGVFIAVLTVGLSEGAAAEPSPLLSLRGAEVQIGGELELEYIDSEDDQNQVQANKNPFPRFALDKIVITPQVHLDTGIRFKADIEFNSSKMKIDEAWIKIPGFPLNTWLKIGLEDIFSKPHRKTESYPLLGHAFWQDEDLGLFAGGEYDRFYWRLSLTNGRRLKDRKASENNVFPITTDDDDNVEENSNKQIGFGLGIDYKIKEGHQIDILPFYYTSDLSVADITYLNGISGYPAVSADNDQVRYGLNLDYALRDFSFFGQYMKAKDGAMDRDGWYVQPSYKVHFGYPRLKSVEFLVRYEEYNVDLVNDPTDSRTWDRTTTVVALLSEVVKGFKIKAEYDMNEEKTNGPDVDNNELVVQLEVKF
jgi:hypothetical protein